MFVLDEWNVLKFGIGNSSVLERNERSANQQIVFRRQTHKNFTSHQVV